MKEIIESLATETGVTADNLRKWKERGKVPKGKRFDLYLLAERKGLDVSARDFEFKPTKGTKPRKPRRAA